VELHLGSKGFFTEVFIDLEDKDRVFEGGPYFHASAGLYMQGKRIWKKITRYNYGKFQSFSC